MIAVRTSPAYVNRVRQDWTDNGGVYGDGGVYAVVPSNDPFAQLGATLDLTFAGVPTDQLTAATANGYSINLNLSSDIYQIAAQYVVWQSGIGMASVNFADIVTFTRTGSTATYFNSAGMLTTTVADEPRFDYDPATLLARGFLIEEQRTNSIRNNTMVGAVAGTPGTQPTNWTGWTGTANGMTASINGVDTETGIAYIDWRYQGTYTGATGTAIGPAFEAGNQISASVGQTWTESVYVSLAAGSVSGVTIQLRQVERDSGGTFLTSGDSSAIVPTATPLASQRASYSRTTTNASTAFVQPILRIALTNGQTYDFTLRIGLPQLELGAFATSVIPTTTTALTRSADVASVNTLSPWYNATEGTLYGEMETLSTSEPNQLLSFNDGTSSNRMELRLVGSTATSVRADCTISGVTKFTSTVTVANTELRKGALAIKANDFRLQSGAAGISPVSDAVPTVDRLYLNYATFAGGEMVGWLRRITYYPRRLSNADLQTITA